MSKNNIKLSNNEIVQQESLLGQLHALWVTAKDVRARLVRCEL